MSNQDVDKLEALLESGKALVTLGEEVLADGKVDFADISKAPALVEQSLKFFKAAKEYKEIMEEAKDIDAAELAKLGAVILGK